MIERRYNLTDEYKGNFSVPINDELRECNSMMITEVVYDLNRHCRKLQELNLENSRNMVDLNNITGEYSAYQIKVREILQEAYNQNKRHDDPVSFSVCLMLQNIGKELGVGLK